MDIVFHKMHGLGNDFMLLDCRQNPFSLTPQQIQFLGNRRKGVGFDQLLVIENSSLEDVDARYRIFNQDGSSAEHCGNGVRCVAKFLAQCSTTNRHKITVDIAGKSFVLTIQENDEVRVNMGPPILEPSAVPSTFANRQAQYSIPFNGQDITLGVVSMGNPHAVLAVEDLKTAPVEPLGKSLQACDFFPNQVNVGFMQVVDRSKLRLRVWERGVGETQACGTGACAAVVIGRLWDLLDEVVCVTLTGGDLRIEWQGGNSDPVWMTGAATYVYEGKITI